MPTLQHCSVPLPISEKLRVVGRLETNYVQIWQCALLDYGRFSHVNFLTCISPQIRKYRYTLALVTETQSHALRHCLHSARNICIDYVLNIPKFVCNPEQNFTKSCVNWFRLSSIQAMCCMNFMWYFWLTSWLPSSTDLYMKIKCTTLNYQTLNNITVTICKVWSCHHGDQTLE
jgi:hypothetical protein